MNKFWKILTIVFFAAALSVMFLQSPGRVYAQNSVIQKPFVQMIAEGRVPGYWWQDKFGLNNLITTATDPEDVWEYGGLYPFSADGTFPDVGVADIVSISSSDAGDTQDIDILGLGADGYEVSQLVTLQGQTRVALSTPLWRIYRMQNEADAGDDIAGVVYAYSGTTNTAGVPSGGSVVKATIEDGNNQTQMAIYTIPRGKVGYLVRGEVGLEFEGGPSSGLDSAKIQYRSRRYGKVFKVKKTITLLTGACSTFQDFRPLPDPIPALTDIKIHVASVSNNIGIWATFDIILVDVDTAGVSASYLDLIGQPFQ